MSVATLDSLSVLQKELLKYALRAYYRRLSDAAGDSEDPGCFGIRTFGRTPEADGFDLKRKKVSAEERRKRASARAASGRAVARLVKRGLVESCGRGRWRLTPRGVKVAKALYPELKPPSKREVAAAIASEIRLRNAIHSVLGSRARQKPRAKASHARARVADPEAGIEIPFDF
jgi:hypothetical protein